MEKVRPQIAKFYIFSVFLLIPLYMEDGYFNTLEAKAHAFYVCATAAIVLGILFGVIGLWVKKPGTGMEPGFSLLDAAVAVFGIAALLSCSLSDYGMDAFTGNNGWHMGAFTLALLAMTYFLVSREFRMTNQIWYALAIGCALLFFLGFLNGLDIDPLRLHTHLVPKEHFEYIATVGNVNSYAGYLSLTIPVLSMRFVSRENSWQKVALWVLLVLGFTNLYMANSDGAWLGCGFAYLFFIYYCLKRSDYYPSLFLVGLSFAVGSLLVRISMWICPEMVEFLGIPKKFMVYGLYVPIGIACILIYAVLRFGKGLPSDRLTVIFSRIFMVVSILAVIVVVGYNAMIFDGRWGTKRGWIWTFCMKLFAGFSLKDKLIGVGPDCLAAPLNAEFGDFLAQKWGKRVANAHNEYIQYLITTGLVGAIAYLGMYVGAFRQYRKEQANAAKAAVFFGIIGYAGQAVVNNPQAMNMAILFVLLAVLRAQEPEKKALQ